MSNMRNCDSCNEKHYCKSYGVLSYCDKCVNSAVAAMKIIVTYRDEMNKSKDRCYGEKFVSETFGKGETN